MTRRSEKVARVRLSSAYVENMTEFIARVKNISIPKARAFVVEQVKAKIQPPGIRVVETIKPGRVEERTYSLSNFLTKISDKVVTPSGSVFHTVKTVRSILSILITEFKADRKAVKGAMFKALANGARELAKMHDFGQASIKVTLNSLPGSFGYPSSIFYDKGCYNAVTSAGRMLISNSFICCEQFLGGNLVVYDEQEAINLLVLVNRMCVADTVKIAESIRRHDMKSVSREQVTEYFNNSLKRYSLDGDLSKNKTFVKLLETTSDDLVQFLWYFSNMQHIIFGNAHTFLPELKDVLGRKTVGDVPAIKAEEFFKLDDGIMAVTTTILAKEIDGLPTVKIPENPKLLAMVVGVYHAVKLYQDSVQDLFDVFIYHNINFQKILTRNKTQRECVVVSDTDSVIFTAMAWSTWYTGQSESLNHDSYCIGALATYWLNLANDDTMAKFAISMGVLGKDIEIIGMKSEFMYTAMLLFDIKKVYAALALSREGSMFKELEPDLKGSAIRGIGASARSRKFITEVLVEDVLKPAISGTFEANEIISKVVKFEAKIKRSLQHGGMDFIPIASVKTADMYKSAKSSAYFNCMAWNEIFGDKYELVQPPNKLPLLKVLEPTDSYLDWLNTEYPDTYVKFVDFLARHKKKPGGFFLPPTLKRIPKELAPIVNMRDITYFNVSPVYLTLNSLNIGAGFSEKHVLLSEVYGGR